MTTKHSRTPGRPRQFDPEQAIEAAQHLFHSRGYDAVSVADLTKAFGINPPSFYAAFGSKLGLYTRVLKRYRMTDAIPLGALLRHDRP
ncbi:TetR/AcrR family transcriptional regulator, partial [Salmonella enterica subsp. enterica]|nr:TetR/AcrR family transcriptional regulator [Salmonella enterica subsp. enterica]